MILNFGTDKIDVPSAVLIRSISIEGFSGLGRVRRELVLDKSFYGEDLNTSQRIWVEDSSAPVKIITSPRIEIDYAGEPLKSKS